MQQVEELIFQNEQLKKELSVKNRELEIEASLERVRAQAMAMHKSEELLSVCEVMYKELKVLGFEEIRNAMIHTFNDKKEFFWITISPALLVAE